MKKLKARKVGDGHIGKFVTLNYKLDGGTLSPIASGKLVNYQFRQKDLEVDFILGGSFDSITIDQNDIVEILDYVDAEGWVVL